MFKSLVDGARSLASSSSSSSSNNGPNNPPPPPPPDQAQALSLFPTVRPDVDGADCLRDCDSCTTHYPPRFDVDQTDALYGNIKAWATHVLVATGKTDWVRDVADEKGSVMEAIGRFGAPANGRLMLSASNMPANNSSSGSDYSQPTTVLLLPAFVLIDNVTPAAVPALMDAYVSAAPTTTTAATKPASIPRSLPGSSLTSRPSPHAALVLLCSQRTRDARCGQSAPLLRRELERHLRALGLHRDPDDARPGGVGVYFVSHVGGHKYSANVLVYRRPDAFGLDGVRRAAAGAEEEERLRRPRAREVAEEEEGAGAGAGQCIWLARVRPEDCEGIVKFTILQGKVVKPERQLRGGFDRCRGVYSW